jgi:hypothetical protein
MVLSDGGPRHQTTVRALIDAGACRFSLKVERFALQMEPAGGLFCAEF